MIDFVVFLFLAPLILVLWAGAIGVVKVLVFDDD